MSELALVEERAVSDRNEEQLVTMTVEGQLFGLPILSVQDIVETHKITQVPRTPSAISGIMNLRGRIVTVINLRRILGRSDDSNSRMGVTVEFKGDLYTILVDQIGEVRLLNRKDFEAAPATLDTKLKQLCTGIYRLDGELLAVLDVNQILSLETIAQTPPIQFFARRPKDNGETRTTAKKALPAAEEAVSETEPEEPKAPAAKQTKNLFRKQKSAASDKVAGKESSSGKSAGADDKVTKAATEDKPVKAPAPKAAAPAKKPAVTSATPAAKAGAKSDSAATPKGKTGSDVSPCAPKPIAQTENLLDLLGGESALSTIVTAFYERVAADKKLSGHYEGADMQRQAKAMQEFLSSVLKGGNSKPVAARDHQWLSPKKGMNDDNFNSCLNHFEAALHARKVPEGTSFRVLAAFERYRESIVD
jgi:purine-binding chemotaxis protein CheW